MINKQRVITNLKKGYTPQSAGAKPSLAQVFDHFFKPLMDGKKLDLFFDIFETDEPILRAWGFLGIYKVMEGREYLSIADRERLTKIITEILNDEREIEYLSGKYKTIVTLREHHGIKVSWIHSSFTFDPVLKYCMSKDKPDRVIGALLEDILSKEKDSRVEPILLKHAEKVDPEDYGLQLNLVSAFENFGTHSGIEGKIKVGQIFKAYLNNVDLDKSEEQEENEALKVDIRIKKKKLQDNVFKAAASLKINLKSELLAYIKSLDKGFEPLGQIATHYKDDSDFKSSILKKLEETTNPHLISNLLEAVLVIRYNVPKWRELVLDNIEKYELDDPELIKELGKADLVTDSLAVKFLNARLEWQLNFVRQFLMDNPEKFDEWPEFRLELVKVLEQFQDEQDKTFENKKRFVLRVLIDLDKRDMIKYCLENFSCLDSDELKKTALFAMINLGSDEIWIELRKLMEEDPEKKEYITKFWKSLERREWKFHY